MPIFALFFGFAGGGTAAIVFAPAPKEEHMPNSESGTSKTHSEASVDDKKDAASDNREIVKLPSQFVVPVILNNRVRAMVILAIALEVEAGQGDRVRELEPKLRDEFLAELFNLAAIDGFKDELITRKTLELVKRVLRVRSNEVLGMENVTVLITDMARQDSF